MTLPKKLRSKYRTIHYIALEVSEGVLLKPIDDVEYYEEKDGSRGLRFAQGIAISDLLKHVSKANAEIEKGQKKSRKRRG